MSLTIIKAGLQDTLQDSGRHGYQHLGINPGGAMDRFSAQLASALLGRTGKWPVLEFHFPASTIRFNRPTVIAITGADFTPAIDGIPVALNQPLAVNKATLLTFKQHKSGARCYMAVYHRLSIKQWLNSYATNLKAEAGGLNGHCLKAGDELGFEGEGGIPAGLLRKNFFPLPFFAKPILKPQDSAIGILIGPHYEKLTISSQWMLTHTEVKVSPVSDRMGYRLQARPFALSQKMELVSTGATFGTVQLLPNGQLILLMADHQTTGGYPIVANVITAHLPIVSQLNPGDRFFFRIIEIEAAQKMLLDQHRYFASLGAAASFKMAGFFGE